MPITDFTMLRASELTLESGYRYFVIMRGRSGAEALSSTRTKPGKYPKYVVAQGRIELPTP